MVRDNHTIHPEILVHIHARSGEYALEDTSFDAAINVGIAPFPHLVAHRLIDEEIIMVGSPEALARWPVRSVEDVSRHRLLHNANRLEAWREWFDRQRVPVRGMRAGAQFDVTLHLIQAATAGLGLALVARFLVEAELASGLLAQVPVPGLESGRAYDLLYPPEKADHAPLAAFRDWIGAQG